ncbi:hypothetical protein [Ruegeria arenilitoris]|uniref:hypothetical protein n=1 Tax=Ruegeria arenilitoris TaxID=1173585 RepID=UPI00147DDEC8|nr:hypothetical protein [Ruegeria arenilitoris]
MSKTYTNFKFGYMSKSLQKKSLASMFLGTCLCLGIMQQPTLAESYDPTACQIPKKDAPAELGIWLNRNHSFNLDATVLERNRWTETLQKEIGLPGRTGVGSVGVKLCLDNIKRI